jgi:hypothetical protein
MDARNLEVCIDLPFSTECLIEGGPINWNSLPVLRGKLLARRSTGEGWEAVWRVDRDSRVFSQLPRGDLWHRESACVRRIRILKRLFRTRASLTQPTYNSADGCNPSFPCISSQDPFPAFCITASVTCRFGFPIMKWHDA